MSDIEDEMDVDAPSVQDAITFSSKESTRGKRAAANLPVEAEDSLPWVEKYRPNSLDDVSGHQDVLATINKFVEANVRVLRSVRCHIADQNSDYRTCFSMDLLVPARPRLY